MDAYQAFVKRLAAMPAPPNVCNPYASADALTRRANLTLYLRRMAERRPRLLLVGEAPGYRGCRVTGVPFTSAAVLLAEPSPFGLFGAVAGFHAAGERGLEREATATILWATLVDLGVLPLLWNAFPFHPHRPGQPASNRPPTGRELETGRSATADLLTLFEIEHVIAVGERAAGALARWSIPAARVRHPSHGGKAAFARQLSDALRDL